MANVGMMDSPISPFVLSQPERTHLEKQVRRHRVAGPRRTEPLSSASRKVRSRHSFASRRSSW